MKLKLEDIVVEPTTTKEFMYMHRYWYGRWEDLILDKATLKISSPLAAKNYESLLRMFMSYKKGGHGLEPIFSDQVSFNNKGRWEKRYARKMGYGDIRKIVPVLENDVVKKGHLEFYFKPASSRAFSNERVKLKFVDINGSIYGYEVLFSEQHRKFFTWSKEPSVSQNTYRALWVPNFNA